MGDERKIYRVAELTRLIKLALEQKFGTVWVEGELSNVRRPSSGHYYFTIKDEFAQIAAVLFRGNQSGLKFNPGDGMQVRVLGEISVYEKSGNYQVIVRQMEEAGQGALQARFEELKRKLQAEGLFDDERKKPIPLLPQHVGVITSPTGAAIRDVLNVVSRRFPNMHLLVAPARVQGEKAAGEIAAAIDLLNQRGGLDVLIVCRGGGSLEDLWCFNEEIVARAIARSVIPVISAVGHEIDFTISDFTADLRAPTPSSAAELVVGRKEEFEEDLRSLAEHLVRSVERSLLTVRSRLSAVRSSYVFHEPVNMVRQYMQRLDNIEIRLGRRLRDNLAGGREEVRNLNLRTLHAMGICREYCGQNIKRIAMQLKALNPMAVLDRGYSLTSDERGRFVRSVGDIRAGQRLVTMVAKGRFESEVTKTLDE